jgi:transposase, IS6 family
VTKPAEFKWRQFGPQVILMAVGWYLRYSLSYRDVEELVRERGLSVDHVTVWRWVQHFAPEIDRRLRPHLKATNKSWRVDETYIRVKGKWTYLYRAVDSTGAGIDFLLSARRGCSRRQAVLSEGIAFTEPPHPRVINVDKNPSYPPVVEQLKSEGTLRRRCQLRPVQYLNNIVEQDHRAIKRRVRASQGFRSFWGAWRTIQGYEAMHAIRKGQARRIGFGQIERRLDFVAGLFQIAR